MQLHRQFELAGDFHHEVCQRVHEGSRGMKHMEVQKDVKRDNYTIVLSHTQQVVNKCGLASYKVHGVAPGR